MTLCIVKSRNRFTEPEIAKIDAMLERPNVTLYDIAEAMGRSCSGIEQWLLRNGYKVPTRKRDTPRYQMPNRKEVEAERLALEALRKPTFAQIARGTLGDNVRFDAQENYLWINGNWRAATVTDIMRRVNEKRVRDGLPQITTNAAWETP